MLYRSFPLVISFTHGSVYMSVLLAQFIPLSQIMSQFVVYHGSIFFYGSAIFVFNNFVEFHAFFLVGERIFQCLHAATTRKQSLLFYQK